MPTKPVAFVLVLAALPVAGCTSIARWTGATCTIKGIVRDRDDGSPIANIRVKVTGQYHGPTQIFAPSRFISLQEVETDGAGQFSCTVPRYEFYRFYIDDKGRWAGPIFSREHIAKVDETVILVSP